MKRGFWVLTGLAAGAYALVRGKRAMEIFTSDGLRDRWSGLSLGAQLLRDEVVRAGVEREEELRERFGLLSWSTLTAPGIAAGRPRPEPQLRVVPPLTEAAPDLESGPVAGAPDEPDDVVAQVVAPAVEPAAETSDAGEESGTGSDEESDGEEPEVDPEATDQAEATEPGPDDQR